MKLIRMTTFFGFGQPPMLTVVEESSLAMPFEESLINRQAGSFTAIDRFEVPDSTPFEDAIMRGIVRAGERESIEGNMAVLYFYNADMLRITSGILINPAPAPLSAEDIIEVLKQLALHPNYEGQTVITTSEDGITCTLDNGQTTKEEL